MEAFVESLLQEVDVVCPVCEGTGDEYFHDGCALCHGIGKLFESGDEIESVLMSRRWSTP